MLRYSFFLLIFILNFTILSCDKSVSTSGLKPEPVVFVDKTEDMAVKEKGIDAIPDGDKIRIEWYRNIEPEIERYRIYRSEKIDDSYDIISTTTDTVYEDMVETHTQYFYYVTAETDEGVTSEPSDTINYYLFDKAILLVPDDTVDTAQPTFIWRDPNEPFYHEYIIRIVRVDSNKTIWTALHERASYSTDQEEITFNADAAKLLPEIHYKWRVDIKGDEESGSESYWRSLWFRGEI